MLTLQQSSSSATLSFAFSFAGTFGACLVGTPKDCSCSFAGTIAARYDSAGAGVLWYEMLTVDVIHDGGGVRLYPDEILLSGDVRVPPMDDVIWGGSF